MEYNHRKNGESALRHEVVSTNLNKVQAIAQLDCRDLTMFKDAMKKRANAEEAKTKKIKAHLDALKKSLLMEQRKRDEAKKSWMVSTKQREKCLAKVDRMKTDMVNSKKTMGLHVRDAFK